MRRTLGLPGTMTGRAKRKESTRSSAVGRLLRLVMEWTAAGQGVRFMALVHHDDAEREWAYDRKSDIGRLDKAWDEANAKGWTVVSMKDDWKTIFPTTNQ